MNKRLLFFSPLVFLFFLSHAQLEHIARYEIDKDLNDDFFTVMSLGEDGVMILRDINKKFSLSRRSDGNEWEVRVLDINLEEKWTKEFSVEYDLNFNAFDLKDNVLYLLFRDGQYEKSDYLLHRMDLTNGEYESYEIENDLALNLSHITILDGKMLLAGYVRYSPTVVSYTMGAASFEVIPGFFKDRSDIVDLKANENSTFNVLTQEKEYDGYFLRLRTYGADGIILFERKIPIEGRQKVLSGRTTDFVDGNLRVCGIYGSKNSYYAKGIYFGVVKPEGQDNEFEYIDFIDMQHFFDYMGERRANRIKRKIERKEKAGQEYKFSTRVTVQEVEHMDDEFLISAEVYDPQYSRPSSSSVNNFNYPGVGFSSFGNENNGSTYVRQSNPLVKVDDANQFRFMSSIILKVNKSGKLIWDESFVIDDIEKESLEPVADWYADNGQIGMLYRDEEKISYKLFLENDSTYQGESPIELKFQNDEIKYTYELIGGAKHWFNNNFLIWGDHKVGNKSNPDVDRRRNVLYINKVRLE